MFVLATIRCIIFMCFGNTFSNFSLRLKHFKYALNYIIFMSKDAV